MLEGLLYNPAGSDATQQTRSGIPIYNGSASGFDEWKFKSLGLVRSIKKQCDFKEKNSGRGMENQLDDLSAKVCEALEGEALRISVEIGHDELGTKDGVQVLVDAIEKTIPLGDKEDDARELYHLGAKSRGQFARQCGESMVSHIGRRLRWWLKLKSLDGTMSVSESILADYLLLCAGLSPAERLMIKTAIGSSEKTFAIVASFLRKHHPNIHETELKEMPKHHSPPSPHKSLKKS